VFATSRPDLVEVDLKRQGRLDVHIPLFPPETAQEREALLLAIAKKLKLPLTADDLPPFTDDVTLGGNEHCSGHICGAGADRDTEGSERRLPIYPEPTRVPSPEPRTRTR
jgi:hypothetical protein